MEQFIVGDWLYKRRLRIPLLIWVLVVCMWLRRVAGNSYVFEGATNMGLYTLNGECILVDTGFGRDNARKALKILRERGLSLTAVLNTHCHADHCGGNHFISWRTRAEFYAPRLEVPYIEKPELHVRSLYGLAYPPQDRTTRLLLGDECRIQHQIESGVVDIGDAKFTIIPLPGHSVGQVGVLTEDNVLYAGDAIFTQKTLRKHPIPFYVDPDETINSLERLVELGAEVVVPGHGEVLRGEDIRSQADYYSNRIRSIENAVLEALKEPLATEEVVARVASGFGVEPVMLQYLLVSTTIKGHLTSLLRRGAVTAELRGFRVFWRRVRA